MNAETSRPSRVPWWRHLHWQILVAMLIGAAAGLIARVIWPVAGFLIYADEKGEVRIDLAWFSENIAQFVGQIFLRLIFMVVIPLVFTALALAVLELGDLRKLGRLGGRTLLMTAVLSSISVLVGLTLVNTVRPGDGLDQQQQTLLQGKYAKSAGEKVAQAEKAKTLKQTLLDIIPNNPLQEMVGALDGSSPGGGMLAVMFFALIFGVAMTQAGDRAIPLAQTMQGVYDTVMVILGWAMRIAPLGVLGLMFALTAQLGFDILRPLAWYVAVVVVGLGIQMFVVYSAAVWLIARRSPKSFFADVSQAMLTAFATSSSNATLPTALRVAEDKLRLQPSVARFVLTVGSTANQNGTALYEGITVLFLAQVFGIHLSLMQQVTVVLMSVLAGIGTAGVPGGSLPLIVIVLKYVGVPADGIFMILGVDRILDMCRTTVNVVGDLAVAACVDEKPPAAADVIPAAANV